MTTEIKEKIKKLLALSTSSNEFEAQAAMIKAKELMLKNKLTEDDFEEIKKQKIKTIVCDGIIWTTDSGKIWLTDLINLICNEYLCTAAWQTAKGTRTHKLVITGMQDDVEVCKSVVEYAVGFVDGTIRYLQRKSPTRDPKVVASSYAKGFILGLEMAFEDQKEEHPEWALVAVKPQEVLDYEKSLGNKTVKTRKVEFDALSYMRGQKDGSEFNARKVIGG